MQINDHIHVREPQLVYHNMTNDNKAHWALHCDFSQCMPNYQPGQREVSYKLEIRYYHGDPDGVNHYVFKKSDDEIDCGDYFEVVTKDEFHSQCESIRQYEDEFTAAKWAESNNWRIGRGVDLKVRAALIKRWEALCELISPNVTL